MVLLPTRRVLEALRTPATWRVLPIELEALLIKPPLFVVRPKVVSVPETETLPDASMEKRPSTLLVEVAILNELAVRVEVVVPSVTWKM